MRKIFLITVFLLACIIGYAQSWIGEVGGGVEDNGGGVYCMGVHDSLLYVGGAFTIVGGQSIAGGGMEAEGIASWNEANWDTLASGVQSCIPLCFESYNGQLFVGGDFNQTSGISNTNGIARWWNNTKIWGSAGGGLSSITHTVNAMTTYNGELYAGGNFNQIGGITAYGIARWDGSSWSTVSNGISGTIYSMAVYKGELYVGGNIAYADALQVNYIARWDGTQWKDVGGGVGGSVGTMVTDTINDVLYVGVGGVGIRMWDGNNWYPISGAGTNDQIPGGQDLIMYHGELYSGGGGACCGSNENGDVIRWIGRYDGVSWKPVGTGTNSTVSSFAVWNDTLYVGGYFTEAGGDSAYYIAKWHSPEDTTCNFMQAGIGLPKDTVFYTDSGMVQFSDGSTASAHWWWDFGDGVVDSVRDPLHVYDSAGVYNISLKVKYNNCPDTAYATLTVIDNCSEMNAAIAASADTVFLSDVNTVQFYDSSNFAGHWQWDFGDDTVSNEQNPVHTYDSVGVYEVQLVVNAGYCRDTAVYTIVVEQETGTSTLLNAPKEILKIYPNPTGDDLTIEIAEANQPHTIHIYDVKGRRVKQLSFSGNVYTFSADELTEGIYYVTLQGTDEKLTQKVVIRR